MSLFLAPHDFRLTWQGVVSLQEINGAIQPWRIPHQDRVLFAEPLVERAAMASGARIAFISDTRYVSGTIDPAPELSPIDLYCDGRYCGSVPLEGKSTFCFEDLLGQEKLVELWLPQFGQFRLRSLALSDGATVAPYEDPRPRWITYGSSITHCRTAASPSQTWPAIVARRRGLNLTSLGLGGQCHLDPMVARLMRDLPADLLSMCIGINIYGGATLNARTFGPGIIGFVQIVREKHPDTPLVVMSPIYSPPRETTPNAVGFTLQAMREEVAAAVATLQAHGDRHIHYVNGLDIFGVDLGRFLPDELHPDPEGYRIMAQNFLEQVIAHVFPA